MNEPELLERAVAEQGQLVMPFYLVFDVSLSMQSDIAALNDALNRLMQAIRNEPVVDDVAQLSVLTFSDVSTVATAMEQPSKITLRPLTIEGGTNYGAAFRQLAKTIESDTATLKSHGYKVYRPCVFFLTDGEPQDSDWHHTFTSTLTYDVAAGSGMKNHPLFIPFGYRNASEAMMRQLAYPPDKGKWYFAHTHSIEDAVTGILDIIMKTVVTGARTAATGQPAVPQLPAAGSVIVQGDSDYDPDFV